MSSAEQSGDNPQRAGSDNELVRQLSEAVSRLAGDVSGPLRRVSLQAGGAAVELEWDNSVQQPLQPVPSAAQAVASEVASESATEEDGQAVVRSPMVGTFYHAPAPGEPPFVSVGGMVEPDTVIGIVEAMKLMNRITAEAAGVVRNVLVPDGTSVEFEQPLIVLDPLPNQQWAGR